jgi:2-polyprenyl-3-methyl-5-hydroxy-6-metoxy-1,4-benzoquinol methylase
MTCKICGGDLTCYETEIREGKAILELCLKCGTIHLEPEQENLKDYYANAYRKEYGPDLSKPVDYEEIFNTYVKYQVQRVKVLEPYLGKDKTLLDVGCSTGHFIANILDKVKVAVGVDWDGKACEYAYTRVKTPFYSPELSIDYPKFDIVYSSMTLEHTEDPLEFLNQISTKLKPDGTIYIEVPNLNDALLSVYQNEAYKRFYFRKAHLWYFTPYAFLQLMAHAGFVGELVFMQDYNIGNHNHWVNRNEPQNNANDGLRCLGAHDEMYRDLLCRLHVSDNMAFIGKRV